MRYMDLYGKVFFFLLISLGVDVLNNRKWHIVQNNAFLWHGVNSQITLQLLNNLKVMFRILKQRIGRGPCDKMRN